MTKIYGEKTIKTLKIKLKSGKIVEGDLFEKKDFLLIKKIFTMWQNLNKELKRLKGRNLNVPDVFSEALYCYLFNAIRTNNTAYSYDAVDIKTGEGIQIKSASIENDVSSFGPTSTWDKLYFIDFAPNGIVDGRVYFYLIPNEKVYSIILNKNKKETFID